MVTTTDTLADVAATSLGAVRILERLSLDYCCGGKRPLEEVCSERGLDARTLLASLIAEEETLGEDSEELNLKKAAPTEIIRHIVDHHHAYLRRELPRLTELGAHVAEHHGEREPRLNAVTEVLATLRTDLEAHLRVEEQRLFARIFEECVPEDIAASRALR